MPDRLTPTLEAQTCPCCAQTVKLYRRKLNNRMVAGLVALCRVERRISKGEILDPKYVIRDDQGHVWVHCKLFSDQNGSGDYAKLRFWDLISSKDKRTKEENASGYWRITPKGLEFLQKHIRVPKVVFVYNNEVHSVSPELVGLGETSDFDYREI